MILGQIGALPPPQPAGGRPRETFTELPWDGLASFLGRLARANDCCTMFIVGLSLALLVLHRAPKSAREHLGGSLPTLWATIVAAVHRDRASVRRHAPRRSFKLSADRRLLAEPLRKRPLTTKARMRSPPATLCGPAAAPPTESARPGTGTRTGTGHWAIKLALRASGRLIGRCWAPNGL